MLLARWMLDTHPGSISRKQPDYYLDEFTFDSTSDAIPNQLSAIGSSILGHGKWPVEWVFRERLPPSIVNRIDFSFRLR